jgi:hypothetical protein
VDIIEKGSLRLRSSLVILIQAQREIMVNSKYRFGGRRTHFTARFYSGKTLFVVALEAPTGIISCSSEQDKKSAQRSFGRSWRKCSWFPRSAELCQDDPVKLAASANGYRSATLSKDVTKQIDAQADPRRWHPYGSQTRRRPSFRRVGVPLLLAEYYRLPFLIAG